MDPIMLTLTIVGVLVLAVILWFIATYNGFVRLRNLVEEAWRQVDVELHRRYDLIPNLVETVKGYASHERGVFEEVTRARAAAAQPATSRAEQAANENALTAAIGRLFAVAEAYPSLKADANFRALQSELTNTEDRIAAGRRYYNANVREFNTRLETFPQSIVGGMTGFRRATYFEAEGASRDVPRVDFGQGGGSGAPRP
ncbi:MAG: LemA family protein [Actinomycetales bacterium]|nr:LemA family protein [Actinomycetales bacterium]